MNINNVIVAHKSEVDDLISAQTYRLYRVSNGIASIVKCFSSGSVYGSILLIPVVDLIHVGTLTSRFFGLSKKINYKIKEIDLTTLEESDE